ncbi:hypothetical protein L195_g042531 [Trifolium pratense]|uniref:Uncharacterized protein n=1 Tax=Trifolium pratense TaxID=57577 RepID=A0A2K3KH49_TRIPR|nr:hypothetical protein L195_g052487 [Trifolium pratense]PNX65605.1 hypothetical protein L195_g054622 [Trifolium pratense]PNX86453.1 hypothetical protein L195_g042531 [Trifolium pratense]
MMVSRLSRAATSRKQPFRAHKIMLIMPNMEQVWICSYILISDMSIVIAIQQKYNAMNNMYFVVAISVGDGGNAIRMMTNRYVATTLKRMLTNLPAVLGCSVVTLVTLFSSAMAHGDMSDALLKIN